MMGDEADDIIERAWDDYERHSIRQSSGGHKCSVCGGPASIKPSTVVYGKDYGLLLICDNYPTCDSYVGCHKGTLIPKGTTANRVTRELRKLAHQFFDAVWYDAYHQRPRGPMAREAAYQKLAQQLKIPVHECHIGMFNDDMCRDVIRLYGPEQLY